MRESSKFKDGWFCGVLTALLVAFLMFLGRWLIP